MRISFLIISALQAQALAGTTSGPASTSPVAPTHAALLHPNAHGAHRPSANLAAADGFGTSINLVYESSLYYRGRFQGDDAFPLNLDLDVTLGENLTWVTNAELITFADSDIDERSHLYTGVFWDNGTIAVGPSFKWYHFFGSNPVREDAYEAGLQALVSAGKLNLGAGFYYEFESEGTFIEVGASMPIRLTDTITLVPAVEYGWCDQWMNSLAGSNHLALRVSLPVKLGTACTLTPFVSANIPLSATDAVYDDEFISGCALSLKF